MSFRSVQLPVSLFSLLKLAPLTHLLQVCTLNFVIVVVTLIPVEFPNTCKKMPFLICQTWPDLGCKLWQYTVWYRYVLQHSIHGQLFVCVHIHGASWVCTLMCCSCRWPQAHQTETTGITYPTYITQTNLPLKIRGNKACNTFSRLLSKHKFEDIFLNQPLHIACIPGARWWWVSWRQIQRKEINVEFISCKLENSNFVKNELF